MERDFKCFSGHPAVEVKLKQRQLFERFSASLALQRNETLQGRKKFMSAYEATF